MAKQQTKLTLFNNNSGENLTNTEKLSQTSIKFKPIKEKKNAYNNQEVKTEKKNYIEVKNFQKSIEIEKFEKTLSTNNNHKIEDLINVDVLALKNFDNTINNLTTKQRIIKNNRKLLSEENKIRKKQKSEVEDSSNRLSLRIPKFNTMLNSESDFESTPQYIIRNRSPLQMTLVKVASSSIVASCPSIMNYDKFHNHHRHFKRKRKRHSNHLSLEEYTINKYNNNKNEQSDINKSSDFNYYECDNNNQIKKRCYENATKNQLNINTSDNKQEIITSSPLLSIVEINKIDKLKFAPKNPTHNIEPLLNINKTSENKAESSSQSTTKICSYYLSKKKRCIKNKKMNFESRISTIKERLMSGVSPMKPVPNLLKLEKKFLLTSFVSNDNSSLKNSIKLKNVNNLKPTSCSPHSQISAVTTTSLSTFASPNLNAFVLSNVSDLIRAEIYQRKSTFLSDHSNSFKYFVHGILRGAMVWAKAPLSAYWPGLVIDVAENSVKIAWCGEHTYNQVDISTVSDFMNFFTTRFNPRLKGSKHKEHNNKKFCNAVAEAIALVQPKLSILQNKLNFTVAKILITKFHLNLNGLTVYRGGKPVVIDDVNNKHLLTNDVNLS